MAANEEGEGIECSAPLGIMLTDTRGATTRTYCVQVIAADCLDHVRVYHHWSSLVQKGRQFLVPDVTDPIEDQSSVLLWNGNHKESAVLSDPETPPDEKEVIESTDVWAFVEHYLHEKYEIRAGHHRPVAYQMHLILVCVCSRSCSCT
jgi:hypothetical protein